VLEALHIANSQAILFPSLKAVSNRFCGLKRDVDALPLTLFLNSAVSDVNLIAPNAELRAVLQHMSHTCLYLERFQLQYQNSKLPLEELRNLLPKLLALRELDINITLMPLDFWQILLKLPALQKLSLSLSSNIPSPASTFSIPRYTLCSESLQYVQLTLAVPDEQTVISLLQGVTLPRLNQISVTMYLSTHSPTHVLHVLMRTFAQLSPNSPTVEQIQLRGEERDWIIIPKWSAESVVHPNVIQPLFAFPNIRFVSVPMGWSYDLDDAFLIAVADSWPRLQYLHLGEGAPWRNPSRITLFGLRAISKRCPSLNELRTTIDARNIPTDAFSADEGSGHTAAEDVYDCALTVLGIHKSTFSESVPPIRLAAFFLKIFPKLAILQAYDVLNEDSVASQYWNAVRDAMVTFTQQKV